MPVASWIAIGLAGVIPVAAGAARRQGQSSAKISVALTTAALIAGLIGILN